jgi:phage-related protein
MSLLFSFAFRALNASMKAIGEGFQNLAQYSKQTNKDISALKTSLQTLKNSFGTAFAPVLTAITPVLQTLINYLSQALTVMGQFFAVLFTGAKTFTRAKDAQVDYAKSLAKTAKEANKSLSPIDKLNNVSDSGGGYEAPGPQQMFEEVEIDNKLIDKVEEFKTLLEPVISAFDRLKVSVAPFAENVGSGLKWMYDNVLVPLGKWTITELIPSFLDTLGAAVGVLNSLLIAFQPWGTWLWENFLQPLASWAGEAIINGLDSLTAGLNNLSTWILENQELVRTMALIIAGFFAAFKIAEFIAFVAPFVSALAGMISSGTLLSGILGGISTTLSTLAGPVGIAVAAIGLLVYSFVDLYNNSESFRESIAELGRTWTEALQPLADFVGTILADAWDKILKPIIDFFINTLLPNLIDTFKNLWENVLVPLGDFIGTVLQPVFQVLSDLLSMLWEKVILPLAEAVGGVLKKAWDGLYQILNKTIIPIIRKAIDVLKFL